MGGGGSLPTGRDFETIGDVVRRQLGGSDDAEIRNVFLSFAYEDKAEVDLLRGQAKNENTDLEFKDYSVREAFDSERADYLRRKIRERIEQCSVTVVYLSDDSAKSEWVDWEIRESRRLNKGVVAVHKGDTPPATLPKAVREENVKVVPWSQLADAIEQASKNRS